MPAFGAHLFVGKPAETEFLEIEQQGVGIQHPGVVLIDAENAPLEDEERRNMAVAHVDHRNALALAALGDFRRGERAEDGGRGGIRHRPARALLEGVEPGAGRGGRVVQPAGGISLRFSEQGAPEVEAPDAVAFGMVPVILCGGNDEGGFGKPGGAEEAVPETGLVVGQRNGGVSFGAGRRNGDALRLYAFGIVVQGEGRIRRSGGGETGCHLFLNGDGETAAHVVPVQPDGATGGCVAADAVGDAERGGGQDETGPIFGPFAGQCQQDILRPAAYVEAQDRPGGRQQTRNGIPGGRGRKFSHDYFPLFWISTSGMRCSALERLSVVPMRHHTSSSSHPARLAMSLTRPLRLMMGWRSKTCGRP